MEKYELQKLRDLPIEGVAERLGLYVSHHKCLCPFHDDHHASMSFKKNKFKCWSCGESGDTISLAMKVLGKDFLEAVEWLGDGSGFMVNGSGFDKPQSSAISHLPSFDASRFSRFFEHPFLNGEARKFLFEERRLDERVVRWCRLTSWRDKQGVPWLQIPYYNKEGQLVGVQNRNLASSCKIKDSSNDDLKPETCNLKPAAPRFRFPQGAECGIYNLPVLNLLKPGDELYITEGCSDCWAMLSAGHKAIAIPSATLLSKKDVELLQAIAGSKVQGVQLPSPRSDWGFRGATECGSGPTKGSESPFATGFRAGGEANSSLFTLHSSLGITFHMWPDRDEPGERLFLQLQEVLPSLVHHQLPQDCKDFSDYYLKKITV